MNLLTIICLNTGKLFNGTVTSPELLVIIISLFALIIAFLAFRYQVISLCQHQIAEKAKECNKNINNQTQGIIETIQNISYVVSTIITTKQLIDRIIGRKCFLFISKKSLVDQFYLQLHTSILQYIIINKITPSFIEGQVKYHVELQLDYCNKLFIGSIKKYSNATPKEIKEKLEEYKKTRGIN